MGAMFKTQRTSPVSGSRLADFVRDSNLALRAMRKAPLFAFFAVLTVGLGIGASTTVFTIVNTLLLNPLPVRDPSGLVALYTIPSRAGRQARASLPSSYPNLHDLALKNTVFSALAGYTPPLVLTLKAGAEQQRIFGELVTARYFEALGIRPAKGRFFLESEDTTPGSASVAVLSYGAWQRKFGGARNIVGRSLGINGTPFTAIGITPAGFIGVSAVFGPDVWLPATMAQQVLAAQSKDALTDRGRNLFHAIARLKPGITRKQADADMQTVAAVLEREYPRGNENRSISVQPVTDELFSNAGGERTLKFAATGLFVLVGVVLLIGCAGLALGYAGCQLVWTLRPTEVAANLVSPRLDGTVFLFAFVVSLATGLLFGVIPAMRASKTDVIEELKQETRIAGVGRRSVTFANALLAGQVALSLVSLIIAALSCEAYSVPTGSIPVSTASMWLFSC